MTSRNARSDQWTRSLLDCFPFAAAVVDARGVTRFANERAQSTFQSLDGIVDHAPAQGSCRSSSLTLSDLLARANPSESRMTLVVPRSTSGNSWLVRLKQLQEEEPGCQGFLVTWVDPRSAPATDWDLVASIYGLSQAEKRVAALLANGEELASAARTLGIQSDTARSHLKSIFRKMDLHRQQDLVRMATMLSFVC
jgi:DNA-binding CsgD family transcriptional regulator